MKPLFYLTMISTMSTIFIQEAAQAQVRPIQSYRIEHEHQINNSNQRRIMMSAHNTTEENLEAQASETFGSPMKRLIINQNEGQKKE
jgi:hypothetical protein